MTRTRIAIVVAVIVAVAAGLMLLDREYGIVGGHGRVVDSLIARNIEARGGADNWRNVTTLQLSGRMDLGQGMVVPYTIEQKRPGKMCLQYEFDDDTAVQCVTGDKGWKLLPYRGRDYAEAMTDAELREMADAADIDGLLFDSARRGHEIVLLGKEDVDGREADKLEVVLPGGAKRWVYLDAETALEIKMESTRFLRGKDQLITTYFSDWRKTDGVLLPWRQDTLAEGSTDSNFITVEQVIINQPIDDWHFEMPVSMNASNMSLGSTAS